MEVNWKLLVLVWGIMLVPAFCVVMRRIIKCRINESYHTLKEDAGASLTGIDFALGIVWSVFWPFTLMMYVVCRMGWFLWNGLLLRAILVTIDDGSKPKKRGKSVKKPTPSYDTCEECDGMMNFDDHGTINVKVIGKKEDRT